VRFAGEQWLEHRSEVGRVVLEVGVQDRAELAARLLEAGADGGALAAIAVVADDRHLLRPLVAEEKLARAVGRPIVDDDPLPPLDGELGGERVRDRRLDGRALVEGGHDDREAAHEVSHSASASRLPSRATVRGAVPDCRA
jgi:hypothetical protein